MRPSDVRRLLESGDRCRGEDSRSRERALPDERRLRGLTSRDRRGPAPKTLLYGLAPAGSDSCASTGLMR